MIILYLKNGDLFTCDHINMIANKIECYDRGSATVMASYSKDEVLKIETERSKLLYTSSNI